MDSIIFQDQVTAKDVKGCTYCCYVRCKTLIVWAGEMPWPNSGATHFYAQLGLSDNGHVIKELVVYKSWDVDLLDLLNGLAICKYQPSPEVCKE